MTARRYPSIRQARIPPVCRLGVGRFGSLLRRGLRGLPGVAYLAVLLSTAPVAAQDAKLFVTVFDEKTDEPIKDLEARNFQIIDGKTRLTIDGAAFKEELADIMLLIDTSLVGEMVRPLAAAFVEEMGDEEQMAIVSYHNSADLIQDFTTSRKLLHGALEQVEYGNSPRVLDALFAAIDGGFEYSRARRVIVLLSAGVEGRSRVSEAEIIQLARERGVSIYPVYVMGVEKGMFRRLAGGTGGAYFAARRLKLKPAELSRRVYSVMRGYYEIGVSGVYSLGDRIKVEVVGLGKSKRKIRATSLARE